MAAAVAIYLAFNAGRPSAHGWGIAMSTDTAFVLGLLALVGPRFPDRLRAFLLTVAVVDDIVALVVIATVYTDTLRVGPLLVAVGFFAAVLVLRSVPIRGGLVYLVLGAGAWVGLLKSGVEPIVVGLVMGLLVYAYPAPRSSLESATRRFREFREQPTAGAWPALPESSSGLRRPPTNGCSSSFIPGRATSSCRCSHSRTRALPSTVPSSAQAFSSPITLGVLVGYLIGKPLGIPGAHRSRRT